MEKLLKSGECRKAKKEFMEVLIISEYFLHSFFKSLVRYDTLEKVLD